MTPDDEVHVTLIDDRTGQTLAVSKVPVSQLPDTFSLETTLSVGADSYSVSAAEPPAKDQFAREGRLTLRLRKIEVADPQKILFSLPTICGDALPETVTEKGNPRGSVCVIHEDDYRQWELVSAAHASAIDLELADIQRILTSEAAEVGFRKIHVRERIVVHNGAPGPLRGPAPHTPHTGAPGPLRGPAPHTPAPLPADLRWKDVLAKLPGAHPIGAIAVRSDRQTIRGSVAVSLRNGIVLWGVETRGALSVLNIENGRMATPESVAALKRLADAFSLAIVEWCTCRVYGAPAVKNALGDPWDDPQ